MSQFIEDKTILEHWAEILALIILLTGFLIAIVIRSPFIHYVIIFLSSLLCGRILYDKHRTQPIFPFVLIVTGFFLGFMLGAIAANKLAIMLLFFFGLTLSYQAHKRGYVGFFKTAGFIK